MKTTLLSALLTVATVTAGMAQSKVMTPEQLITLNRVSAMGLTEDGTQVVYTTSAFNLQTNERARKTYVVSVNGGTPTLTEDADKLVKDKNTSPDGQWKLVTKQVKLQK